MGRFCPRTPCQSHPCPLQTFPAISHLKLVPPEHPGAVAALVRSSQFESAGLNNLARQLHADPRTQTSRRRASLLSSLSDLSEWSGGLCSVSTLGLECTLSALHLWQPIHVDDLPALSVALEDTHPRRFCFTISAKHVANVFAIFSTLSTQAPPRIDLDILCPYSRPRVGNTRLNKDLVSTGFRGNLLRILTVECQPRGNATDKGPLLLGAAIQTTAPDWNERA